MRECEVDWPTTAGEDDGETFHRCYLPEGHDGDWHWCASHFACWPFCTGCDD